MGEGGDTEPCCPSSATGLLDVGLAPTSKVTSLLLVKDRRNSRAKGLNCLHLPRCLLQMEQKCFSCEAVGVNISLLMLQWTVPGLRPERAGLWSPARVVGFPDDEHLPFQFLYLYKEVV